MNKTIKICTRRYCITSIKYKHTPNKFDSETLYLSEQINKLLFLPIRPMAINSISISEPFVRKIVR